MKKVGIRLHHIHGDSPALDEALWSLNHSGILETCIPSGNYIWSFPITPKGYFDMHIKPKLKEEELSEIEEIVSSID